MIGLAAATGGCAPIPLVAPQSVPLDVPAADRAHIYVTRTSLRGSRYAHQILLDGKATGSIAWRTHLLLKVVPGTHEVTVVTQENSHTVTVEAIAGGNYFLATVPRTGWVYSRAELQVLSDAEGRQAVLDTHRALTAP